MKGEHRTNTGGTYEEYRTDTGGIQGALRAIHEE